MGSEVFALEKKLCSMTGSKNCITVSSGTDALLIALMSIDLKKNDEIIVPAFTYISPVESIVRIGCKPIFVDVQKQDGNIDVGLIQKKITKKTKAIIFVNLFGNMCDIQSLKKIKNKYKKIFFIEDAAQSFGSIYKKYNSCNTLDISCTSFFPTKPLGCYGDGGAIFTNNKKISSKCRMIRQHGQIIKYDHKIVGIGGRLDTIQSAILLAKLHTFKKEIKMRNSNYNFYMKKIIQIKKEIKENIETLTFSKNGIPNYSSFNIIVHKNKRSNLKFFLQQKKISTTIYYPKTVLDNAAYKKFSDKHLYKNSLHLSKKILSLPFDPYLKKNKIKYICESIKNFYISN